MYKLRILGFLLVFLFVNAAVYAQEDKPNIEIPEGMEAVQIGGSGWLIVPKGAKTRKVGSQIIVEGVKEYMSRRFEETDNRLKNIETMLADLTKEVEALKKAPENTKATEAK